MKSSCMCVRPSRARPTALSTRLSGQMEPWSYGGRAKPAEQKNNEPPVLEIERLRKPQPAKARSKFVGNFWAIDATFAMGISGRANGLPAIQDDRARDGRYIDFLLNRLFPKRLDLV